MLRATRIGVFPAMVALLLLAAPPFSPGQQAKQIMGRAEYALVLPEQIRMVAKLDSGARTTSLHAERIRLVEKKGRSWVRFRVRDENKKTVPLEREVVRTARIKRHRAPPMERPVVRMGICLGTIYREVEVNLVDRSNFINPMLIGRNFMAGWIIVDPQIRLTTHPRCRAQ